MASVFIDGVLTDVGGGAEEIIRLRNELAVYTGVRNELHTRAMYAALDTYLSEYPDDRLPEDVLANLNHPDVVIWEPFETYPADTLVEWITTLADAFEEFAVKTLGVIP